MGLEKYYADIFLNNDLLVDLPKIKEQHYLIDLYKIVMTPIHQHLHLEILYIIEGTVSVSISYRNIKLTAGDIVIINPSTIHSIQGLSEDNTVMIVSIDTDYFNLTDQLYVDSATYYRINSNPKNILLKKLLQDVYFSLKNASENSILNSKFNELINILKYNFSLYQFNREYNKESIMGSNEQQAERIFKLFKYLRLNFMNQFKLNNVANEFFINKSYLSHILNDVLGMSFTELVNRFRIDRALVLILGTNLSLNEISEKTGFINYNAFVRNFVKRTNQTPNEYKKTNKKMVAVRYPFNWERIDAKSHITTHIDNNDPNNTALIEKNNSNIMSKILLDEEKDQIIIIIGNYGSDQSIIKLHISNQPLNSNSEIFVSKYFLPLKYFNKDDFMTENNLYFKGKLDKLTHNNISSDISISLDICELPLKISALVDSYAAIMLLIHGKCSADFEICTIPISRDTIPVAT